MNTFQAKKVPIREILSRLGFEPIKTFKGGEELAYLSPFRQEAEPSLFVNIRKNVWNDFGDSGGNALDFVIRYLNTDVKGGLEFLEKLFGNTFMPPIPSDISPASLEVNQGAFLLESIAPFGTTADSLVTYITLERRIASGIANQYLKEVRYRNRENGKSYFAVGFENMCEGYEIRNPFFKSSLGVKAMSLIKGSGAGDAIYIFEGFLDFLSKLTLGSIDTLDADALILNSVSYAEAAIEFIQEKNYLNIAGFLDNDKAGGEVTEKFKKAFGNIFIDMRIEYQNFKDLNDHLKFLGKWSHGHYPKSGFGNNALVK